MITLMSMEFLKLNYSLNLAFRLVTIKLIFKIIGLTI
jgi:hypothetical protein